MSITFGLTQGREKKTEKYDFPVLTIGTFKGEGTARKFYFNKAAVEQLGLTDMSTVCFARTNEGLAIVNCSDLDTDMVPEKIRREIKKTDMSISNRTDFDKVTDYFDLDNTTIHEFKINIKSELVNDETPAGELELFSVENNAEDPSDDAATEIDDETAQILAETQAEADASVGDIPEIDYTQPTI